MLLPEVRARFRQFKDSTVHRNAKNDGLAAHTSIAAAGNGVLFSDVNDDGEIIETREFVFAEWDPTAASDLEALASAVERRIIRR